MRCFAAAAAVAVALTVMTATGCSRAIPVQPEAIEDARLVVRVKTALVNDAELGPRLIEVRVARGVVTLNGLVGSTAEADRAVTLVRGIPGVLEVRSQLVVGQPSALQARAEREIGAPPPVRRIEQELSASRNRLVAVGASLGSQQPTNGRLDSNATFGPMVRLGMGRGLGLGIGFSWFRTDITSEDASETLGRITVRPLMAGVNYTLNDQARWALTLSMVAGLAINSFAIQESTVRDDLALGVDNSFAMRPGVSLWYDINSRTAFNVFSGYVITRPGMTFLEEGQFVRRSVRADAAVFSVGLAWKLF